MKKRVFLAAYLAVWAAIAAGAIYICVRTGYSLWAGVGFTYLLFVFLNGTLAYVARSHQLKQEGKVPPSYLQYLFFPKGTPRLKAEAPRSTHYFTALITGVAGALFVFCSIALAFDAEWSRIPHPLLVVAICLVPGSMGAVLLYATWRIFAAAKRSNVA